MNMVVEQICTYVDGMRYSHYREIFKVTDALLSLEVYRTLATSSGRYFIRNDTNDDNYSIL